VPRALAAALLLAACRALAQGDAQPPSPPAAQAGAQDRLARLLADVDAAFAERDAPGRLEVVRARLEEAEKIAPDDFEVLWRRARLYVWLSDDPRLEGEEKSRLGKRAWDDAERAAAASPARVEGWYYAAVGMGNYSLGIGVITALRKGIEGKFKDRLKKAEAIDPGFLDGAIATAWGRFYFKLPWPKYDARKSEIYLRRALERNPASVRAHVYLADLYEKEDRPGQAREELEAAVGRPAGAYDPPEERRYQDVARERLARKD
jgi:hypothetical protein